MPLLTIKTLPPGGWIYEQQKDGVLFKLFRGQGPYTDFCSSILAVRVANNLPGATKAEVDADVQRYTSDRLGNDPRWCGSGSGPVTQPKATTFQAVSQGGGCAGCGGHKA